MKRLILTICVSLLVVCHVSARTINGIVVSDRDSTAVIGATCELKIGNTTKASDVSNENGQFSVATNLPDTATLIISMTGYTPSEIVIPQGSKDISLGTVFLNEGIPLGEVSVTARETIETRGRTIVFPSAADVKASSTAISLFQKLPLGGLEANPVNRTLTVDGGKPMILINGVPSTMDDINTLQPKDIARIEFSRVTPARYADRGVNGLINITLKSRDDGGQFYGWTRSAVATVFFDANLRASYHQGPSQFSVYYSPSWRNYRKVYDNNFQSYIGDDFRVDLEEHDRNPFNYFSNPFTLKYNYSPTARTLFSATLNASVMTNKRLIIGRTHDSVLGDYRNHNQTSGKAFTPSLDLFLHHEFDDRNTLEIEAVGTLTSDDYRRRNLYDFENGNPDIYSMNVDSRRQSLITEISYTHDFSEKTSLSTGYQNTISHNSNKYLDKDFKAILTENNNYLYATLGQQVNKVYLSLSTGAKLYWVKNDKDKRRFIRNLSTVQASWNVNDKWRVAGAFRYSPGIPSLSALTDYQQQTTPYLVSNGNPDLKVTEYFIYQLMPSFKTGKLSTSLLLTHQNAKNAVFSDIIYLGDKLFLSRSVNSRRNEYTSGNLSVRISEIAGFGANVNLRYTHYSSAGENWSHHLNSFSGNFSLWWNKGPLTLSYGRNIPGKYLSGHLVGKEENYDSFSIDYRLGKHWNLGASWMYMFDKKGTKYPSWNYSSTNPASNDRYITHNGNMVVLSVSYSADFGSIFRSARRSLNNSDSGSSLLKM